MSRTFNLRRRLVGFVAVIALFPLAGRSLAGQSAASLIGQVTDESGAVLPGVTVTATSPALQVPQMTNVTDERGEYRLTQLPIGTYTVEYALAGFQTVRREGVRLTVGFTAKVDVLLKVGTLAESVTVSGASPVVDATSTTSSTLLTKEALELIPTGRNNWGSLMAQAPGARTNLDVGGEAFNGGGTFYAFGQANEPWQSIEGIVTTSVKSTQTGQYVDYTTFEEAKIQTLGNDADVPNRGIMINTVVKSGGNDFHGSGFYAYTNHHFQASNIDAALEAQGIARSSSLNLRDDLSGELGGRIRRDKIWFYGAGRQRRGDTTIVACFQPDDSPCVDIQKYGAQTAKVTSQLNASNKLLAFWQATQKINNGGASRLVAFESRTKQRPHQQMAKLEWQAVKGNALTTSLQFGGFRSYTRVYFWLEKPATVDLVTGVVTGTSTDAGQHNEESRMGPRGSISWYKPDWFGGNHEFKAGFDYHLSRGNRPQDSRGAAGNYQLQFRSGAANQISVSNFPVAPAETIHYLGVYLQDSWTIARRLTLNLGVRYAHDNAFRPAVCREAADPPGDVAYPAECFDRLEMPVWNPVSPRLRAAYDLAGDGKTVIKGGWGRFAHMRVSDELQVADRNVISQTLYRWHDLDGDKLYDPGEVDLSTSGLDFISTNLFGLTGALANGIINPNEAEPWTDEYTLQVERELIPNFAVRVTGAHSRALNQYRLANTLRPYSAYTIAVTNPDPGPDARVGTADDPGTSFTYYEYPAALAGLRFQASQIVNDPKANQTYSTIEVAVAKRLANRWQFMASYTATKKHIPLTPNTGGISAPVLNTQDPNAEIFAADNTWELTGRISGSYGLPYDVLVSGNFEHRSGAPLARTVNFAGGQTIPLITLRVEPLGSTYLPDINLLDLRVQKTVRLGTRQKVDLRLNLYNALNINPVTTQTVLSGPNYGKATAILSPRIFEMSASYSF